jgi:tetratricopeptide (TPR) repeat protein
VLKRLVLLACSLSLLANCNLPAWADDAPAADAAKTEAAADKAADKAAGKPPDNLGDQKDPIETTATNADGDDKKPYTELAVKQYNRGVELHQSGFLNQAIASYKAAIDADKRMEEAWSNLGLIYAAQRNYTKAIEAFNKALTLKPARPYTLNGLGTVLYAKGKFTEAMQKWKQAVEIDPNFASAYYNMGNAMETEKDFSGAMDAYVKAIRINPGMADAYFRIGSILFRDRHYPQATVLLAKAAQLSPDAEFAREAKKQIAAMEVQFAKETDDAPQVEMNVMAPPSAGSPPPGAAPAEDLAPAPTTAK